jgi:heterodisulfide reductase subunit B
MEYALFLGCFIPAREPSYELAVRQVMKSFDVNLYDLTEATCCAPIPIESLDHLTSTVMAAYNLCLAEEAKLDIMPICNGCFQVLSKTNALLRNDKELKEKANEVLGSVGKEYKGTVEVKDYLQVLCDDVGFDKIKNSIVKPLNDLKVAVFYGCHLLKPSSILNFDDPEDPRILDELVELTGAISVPYMYKTKCCGSPLKGVSDELTNKLAREKLFYAKQAQAECFVTVCPSCFLQLDIGQLVIRRKFKESYDLPVLHYPELLALAMGMDPKELGLNTHRIRTDSIIKKIG